MSDEIKLSQAEIDALLSGKMPVSQAQELLTEEDKDALGEIGNISFGTAATALSKLLNQRVEITTPTVTVLNPDDVPNDFPRPYVMVSVEYTAGLTGTNALAIELNDAKVIADLMLGGDGTNTTMELNDLHLSAVAEAMNQMMGGAATALSSMFGRTINISPPTVRFVDLSTAGADLGLSSTIVNTSFRLRIGDLVDSKLMQLVPVSFAKELLQLLRGNLASEQTAASATSPAVAERGSAPHAAQSAPATLPPGAQSAPSTPGHQPAAVHSGTRAGYANSGASAEGYSAAANAAASAAPQSAAAGRRGVVGNEASAHTPVIQKPEFVDFSASDLAPKGTPRNLSLLYDVTLNITVELGRTRKSIREILDLTPGSIVELDKLAGEPVDILVNGKRIAIGEVVVIDENFGVRVTDIISPVERVRNLQ
jgi:flagellar motor switch protein FliN/FliY